jgi:chromosome segregation ATPase
MKQTQQTQAELAARIDALEVANHDLGSDLSRAEVRVKRLEREKRELVEALRGVESAYGCECIDGQPVGHCPMCRARALLSRMEAGQ